MSDSIQTLFIFKHYAKKVHISILYNCSEKTEALNITKTFRSLFYNKSDNISDLHNVLILYGDIQNVSCMLQYYISMLQE